MPLDLATKRDKTRTATCYFDGDPVTLQYKFMGLTSEYFSALDAQFDRLTANTQLLIDAVSTWDITLGGEPYAVTPENVRALPGVLVGALADAIVEDLGKLTERKPRA